MLRLAVITTYFPVHDQPYRGQTAYQALRLLASRLLVQVFCPMPIYPAWCKPMNFFYTRADVRHTVQDVPVQYIEYPAVPGISRPFNGFAGARVLMPHVERFRPDLILNYTLYPEGFASVLLGKRLKIPVILGAIGSDVHSIPDPISRMLTRRALRDASFVITVSEDLRRQVIQLGARGELTRTIPNGVDTSVFRFRDRMSARTALGLNPRSRLILFVGRFSIQKGVYELLNAVTHLHQRNPDLTVAFVGDGLLGKELKTKVDMDCWKGKLLLPGLCGSAQVATWMTAADVFCLPSYAEGCPNVVLEALACGRPVVATAVGDIPEMIDERCGILVPPRDTPRLTTALAAALKTTWHEEAICRKFQRGWEQVATEMFEVCNSLPAKATSRLPALSQPI